MYAVLLAEQSFFFKVCLNMIKELYRIETNKQFAAFCLHKGSFKPMLISVGTSFNGMQARCILYVYFFFFSCTLYVIHIIPSTCADRRGWGSRHIFWIRTWMQKYNTLRAMIFINTSS